MEGAQKVVAQMTTYCSIREEEEVQGDMMAEMELGATEKSSFRL